MHRPWSVHVRNLKKLHFLGNMSFFLKRGYGKVIDGECKRRWGNSKGGQELNKKLSEKHETNMKKT